MDHVVDLSQIQYVVGKYVDKYNLLVAAGPVTVAGLAKTFLTNNKVVNIAIVGGGVWFAVKELSGPLLQLITDQFGYLDSLLSSIK
ncbi:MAG: hypothetical protein KGN84_17270 [Acidobacteriota bacterium]|nr:hypothetical protein [Acidobacteriota bacterium]